MMQFRIHVTSYLPREHKTEYANSLSFTSKYYNREANTTRSMGAGEKPLEETLYKFSQWTFKKEHVL